MRNLPNIETRAYLSNPSGRKFPYAGWDANGTLYHISRPTARRTGWHAWGRRNGVNLAGDLLSAGTLTRLSAMLAAHRPPV